MPPHYRWSSVLWREEEAFEAQNREQEGIFEVAQASFLIYSWGTGLFVQQKVRKH